VRIRARADDGTGQYRLTSNLAVDKRLGLHATQARLEGKHIDLDAQLVAGGHRAAELGLFNAGEDGQFLVAVGNLVEHDDGAGLGHCFDDQHAGHQRVAGKVALKERLIHGYILDGHQALAALELDDAVNQQKRVAVGKQSQDFLDIKGHSMAPKREGRSRPSLHGLYRKARPACLQRATASEIRILEHYSHL